MVNNLFRRSTLVALLAAGAVAFAACGGDDDDAANGNGGNGGNGSGDTTPTQVNIEVGGDTDLQFEGVRVQPQIPKPDFTLTDTNGEPYDIQAETEGSSPCSTWDTQTAPTSAPCTCSTSPKP